MSELSLFYILALQLYRLFGTVFLDQHGAAVRTPYQGETNMARIEIPTKETAPAATKPILERYERNLGVTPNFFSLIARSPDVLSAEANMHATLGKSLGHNTRERIHIMTAEVNGCNYCLSVHTYVGGKFNKMSPEDMELNRTGHSTDPKADAAVQFAYRVAKNRGHVTDADFAAVRAAGFTDEEIIDIVAETAFSFTTNLFNNTFQTDIDSIVTPLKTNYDEQSAK
ncbi:uncharacterized peroxidase-related enzyme [Terriglobus roseus]|uniref:Uncharacterized peroxidase-related enzyme n=2 Tax=Terriglobus roseus TaxID=392734 RepID=A0A1G7HKP8_9BACT|nr:uncharacterized peroxidase-related enzyme [Terriglobus roseus]